MSNRFEGEVSEMTASQHARPLPAKGDDMLTISEASEILRIAEGTLRYWRHQGCGPHSFKIGRHVRYWRSDLLLWLDEQTHQAQANS